MLGISWHHHRVWRVGAFSWNLFMLAHPCRLELFHLQREMY